MTDREFADVVIIGGGPGGLSALAWCVELGLRSVLLESESDIGGQLHRIYGPINNYLGLRTRDGAEMLEHFRESVKPFAASMRTTTGVEAVLANSKTVRLKGGGEIGYGCLIVATGVRRRRLGVPGEVEFVGRGLLHSGVRDREAVQGKRVVIVGGGDAAIENALILSEVATHVIVVHRRSEFTAREEFLRQLYARGNVTLEVGARLQAIKGETRVTGVTVEDIATNSTRNISTDVVLIRVGVEPNSELVSDFVDLDDHRYILVGPLAETSYRGIFAVGDVANPISLTIVSAAGSGATAAKACAELFQRPSYDQTRYPKI